jgi:type II secretory pathway pseudopilin PulG
MVVLAVMAVLIMILVPMLQNARERARATSCQNNLRQYGIAMGRYLSEWKGYFIYPGAGGASATHKEGEIDMSGYEEGHLARGGIAGSDSDSYYYFFADWIPKLQTNRVSMLTSVSSVRICPSVQLQLRNGNYLDPKQTRYFKGFRTQTTRAGEMIMADFEDPSGFYDNNDEYYVGSDFTTYAMNMNIYKQNSQNISPNTVAFVDWNAKEGWKGLTSYTNWMFNRRVNGVEMNTQDKPKCAASNIFYLTEIGFHHKDGTNLYANYVALDGHVAAVSSNQINSTYFSSTGPR